MLYKNCVSVKFPKCLFNRCGVETLFNEVKKRGFGVKQGTSAASRDLPEIDTMDQDQRRLQGLTELKNNLRQKIKHTEVTINLYCQ